MEVLLVEVIRKGMDTHTGFIDKKTVDVPNGIMDAEVDRSLPGTSASTITTDRSRIQTHSN